MPNVFSLVDRGFVYAIAHVRGGSENGYGWYLDGKLDRKKNTFLDFVNAAEHLVAENFTSVGRIVAQGRSAGGMLVGAVVNMRPDLFCGILGEVPFVDVLNTMCDETLPLTPPEWVEWGTPFKVPLHSITSPPIVHTPTSPTKRTPMCWQQAASQTQGLRIGNRRNGSQSCVITILPTLIFCFM